MKKINSLLNNKIFQAISTVILLIISLLLLLNILKLKTKINTLSKNFEDINVVVNKLNEFENSNENVIESFKTNDATEIKNSLSALSKQIDSIDANYVNINQLNDTERRIEEIIYKTNKASSYEFYKDLTDAKIESDSQITDIGELEDLKEDKLNKVNSIDDGDENSYLSVAGVKAEKNKLFDAIYPIGSIYISIDGVKPSYGEWEKLESGRVLWNTDDANGELLGATLPNASGSVGLSPGGASYSGPFYSGSATSQKNGGSGMYHYQMYMDFNRYNPIYQDGATVRPPAITVVMYKRIG